MLRKEADIARSCLAQVNAMIAEMEAMNDQEEYYNSFRSLRDSIRIGNDRHWRLNELIAQAEEDIWTNESYLEIMEAAIKVMPPEFPFGRVKDLCVSLRISLSKKRRLEADLDAVVERGDAEVLALGWHLEEIQVTWAHLEKKRTRLLTCTKIHQEVLFSERGDSVAGIKRHHHDLSGDGVWILATAS
ncbi:hypothetical protein Tco_1271130 [Tanacetum coccineum]